MPASTPTQESIGTSQRGEMPSSWGTVLVAFANWRAAASPRAKWDGLDFAMVIHAGKGV
jgi:hypothetical protein